MGSTRFAALEAGAAIPGSFRTASPLRELAGFGLEMLDVRVAEHPTVAFDLLKLITASQFSTSL